MSTILTMGADHPVPPCGKDCPDRAVGCGITCERWKDYERKRADFYAEKTAKSDAAAVSIGCDQCYKKCIKHQQNGRRHIR